MSHSTEKSLGQIAYAADANGESWADEWASEGANTRAAYERMAQAVAAAVREQCAQECEGRAGMRGTGAWTALTAAADAIRSIKP